MAKIYKKISFSERDSRVPRNLNDTEVQKGVNIIENFIQLFKQKHLS